MKNTYIIRALLNLSRNDMDLIKVFVDNAESLPLIVVSKLHSILPENYQKKEDILKIIENKKQYIAELNGL